MPVSTVFRYPWERVIFHSSRDANPFFHLYESLWMLTGRNDVATLARYVKRMQTFSDDGTTLHGAYGHRWMYPVDQLSTIILQLKANPEDRRNVLQMWDASRDLGRQGKDLPCNLMATFQISPVGCLDMVVFCRSNDIIWGAYGANAVHFSMLQEYVATGIGVPVGTYTQISVNFHAYRELFDKLSVTILPDKAGFVPDPYREQKVKTILMPKSFDDLRAEVLWLEQSTHDTGKSNLLSFLSPWARNLYFVLRAHYIYKQSDANEALYVIREAPDQDSDWVVAATEWLRRRATLVWNGQ